VNPETLFGGGQTTRHHPASPEPGAWDPETVAVAGRVLAHDALQRRPSACEPETRRTRVVVAKVRYFNGAGACEPGDWPHSREQAEEIGLSGAGFV